jgi:hypothetical protein
MAAINLEQSAGRLSSFFPDADSKFGIFYPQHYLLAVYPNFEAAEQASLKLSSTGLGERDVIAVPGAEVVQYVEQHMAKHGLWGALMTELSRKIGTEAVYADQDLARAKSGAAFVAAHCPTEPDKARAWSVLEPTHPVVARYYSPGGVEHLHGEN